MKRLSINFFCCILLLKIFVFGGLLDNYFSYNSHSFYLFSNPSLLGNQKGLPLSTAILIPSNNDKLEGKGAISFIFDNNAFSVGYERNESIKNRIITGYSLKRDFFLFGSSFSFLFEPESKLDLVVDAATTFKLDKDRYISLIFNNLIGTDTIQKLLIPKVSISFFGGFPKIEKYLGFETTLYSLIYNIKKIKIDEGGKIAITGTILKTPMIHYSSGFEIFGNKEKLNKLIQGLIGVQITINELSTGLSCGISYDINKSDYKLALTLDCNPVKNEQKNPPSVNIKIMKGTKENTGLYVSINCSDATKSSSIKKWILIFSTLPSKEGKIVKSFSGGNIPPSTVFWDLRDYQGKYIDQQCTYIRAVISDYRNNISTTPWIVFDPKKYETY